MNLPSLTDLQIWLQTEIHQIGVDTAKGGEVTITHLRRQDGPIVCFYSDTLEREYCTKPLQQLIEEELEDYTVCDTGAVDPKEAKVVALRRVLVDCVSEIDRRMAIATHAVPTPEETDR